MCRWAVRRLFKSSFFCSFLESTTCIFNSILYFSQISYKTMQNKHKIAKNNFWLSPDSFIEFCLILSSFRVVKGVIWSKLTYENNCFSTFINTPNLEFCLSSSKTKQNNTQNKTWLYTVSTNASTIPRYMTKPLNSISSVKSKIKCIHAFNPEIAQQMLYIMNDQSTKQKCTHEY